MERNYLIEKLRRLCNGQAVEDEGLARILESNGCYSLFKQIPSRKMDFAILTAINYNVIKNRYDVCKPIFQELSYIPYAVIKGAVLSDRIYGNPVYRKSGDIDLLISPKHYDVVREILKQNGFIQGKLSEKRIIPYTRKELIYQHMFSHQAPAFMKQTKNPMCPFINMDVNLDIFWGESPIRGNMDDFLSYTENRTIFGMNVKVLRPVHECISLCMHHYKDLNSLYLLNSRAISVSLFLDLYEYFTKVRPDAIELRKVCDQLRVTNYISFCIWHTEQVFSSEILRQYLEVIPPEKDMLNRIGLAEDEYKILEGGVSRALFDPNFSGRLEALLTEQDRKKIEINRMYM